MQSKSETDPPCSHRHVVACHCIHGAACIRGLNVCPVRPLDAKEDGMIATQQRSTTVQRLVQRLIPLLKEHALLWVHCASLYRRNAKQVRVKALRTSHGAAMPCTHYLY